MKRSKVYHRVRDLEAGRAIEPFQGAAELIGKLSRRQVLKAGAAGFAGAVLGSLAGVLGRPGTAAGEQTVRTGQFIFPRLHFTVYDKTPDIWNVHLWGDVNLRRELKKLTNINVSTAPKVVKLGDFDEMCRHPFVFMTSEGHFRLPDNEEKNLREFLERGGFILADDCVYNAKEDRFFRFYVDLVNRLFPDNPMRKIPYDHEIFHIYFDFKDGCPHAQGVPHGAYGHFERGTGRIMTMATPGDIHCGWCLQFFSKEKNLECVKMGINIVIYFLSH
jgi:hypothetical protein